MINDMMRNGNTFILYSIILLALIHAIPSSGLDQNSYRKNSRKKLIITQDVLIEKINAHNIWLKTNRAQGKKLNLSNTDLSGVNFSGIALKWAKLDGANLEGADLSGAKLQGVKLRDANLSKASFIGANLKWAYLEGANLQLSNLTKADLEGADLRKVNLQWAILNDANLTWSTMMDASLQGAKLKRADLHKVNLTKANMQWVRLDHASLKWAYLEGANLERAILKEANLHWAILVNANLKHANLTGAILKGAKIDKANLRNCNFERANLKWADLAGSNLKYATFKLTNLSHADLKKVIFYRTNFEILPNELPNIKYLSFAKHLQCLTYQENPYSLLELRDAFKEHGFREQERKVTYAFHHKNNLILKKDKKYPRKLFGYLKWAMFDITCKWGMKPFRPLIFLLMFFSLFLSIYTYTAYDLKNDNGIWTVERLNKNHSEYYDPPPLFNRLHFSTSLFIGICTALLSLIPMGWGRFNVNLKLAGNKRTIYVLQPIWQLRIVYGAHFFISAYLVILTLTTFFFRPFG